MAPLSAVRRISCLSAHRDFGRIALSRFPASPCPSIRFHACRRRLLHADGIPAATRHTATDLRSGSQGRSRILRPADHFPASPGRQPLANYRRPTKIQLQHDVALPNVVSLFEKMPGDPPMPIGPAPAVPASEIQRFAPRMERSVIPPPPDLQDAAEKILQAPQAAVIAPPPAVEAGSTRRLRDLNIGRSSVISPAPQLSLDEQRAVPGRSSSTLRSPQGRSPQVIAPPPALAASGRSGAGVIALSLHPAVGAPPVSPAGNRRGTFAATPEGHRGASGTPGASHGNGTGSASGYLQEKWWRPARGTLRGGDPAAKNSTGNAVNPKLIAGMRPPGLPAHTLNSKREQTLRRGACRFRQPQVLLAQPEHAQSELRRRQLDRPLRRAEAGFSRRQSFCSCCSGQSIS